MKSGVFLNISLIGFIGLAGLFSSLNAAATTGCVVSRFRDLLSKEENVIVSNAELNRADYESYSGDFRLREIGVITHSNHTEVQNIINELQQAGGELRLLTATNKKTGEPEKNRAYFHYDVLFHIPYIAADPFASLEELSHEARHFRDWKIIRDKLIKRGLKGDALEKRLQKTRKNPRFKAQTETNAIGAQLKVRAQEETKLTLVRGPSERYPSSALPTLPLSDFIRLTTYPQAHALSYRLAQLFDRKQSFESDKIALSLMDEGLRKAILLRRTAFRRAKAQLMDPNLPGERRAALESYASSMEDLSPLFNEIFGKELHKYQSGGTEASLHQLFEDRKNKILEGLSDKTYHGHFSTEAER